MDARFYATTKRSIPHNVWIEARLEEAKSKFDMYQKLRITYAYQSKAASWMRVGDRVTKGCFEAIKCRGSGTQPSCLKKTDGTMTTYKEEMLEIAMRYYSQLLNVCKEDQIDQAAFRNIIIRIPSKVIAHMMDRLNTPIGMQ